MYLAQKVSQLIDYKKHVLDVHTKKEESLEFHEEHGQVHEQHSTVRLSAHFTC